ncbi:hypothetical protein [Brevundimonas sp. UBA7534]|uniref:hypothetical protein n=1 Tax=Brevundimonas sp. UBA7534 TaxID=1946138 RepID=UPI0025BE51EA|nr:hypothetical protein [Brevundimonas sp. UBA7534]
MTQLDPNRTPEAPRPNEGQGHPVDARDTRQGRPGVRILWLLIVSAGAAAVLLLGLWLVSQGGFSQTNANNGAQAVDAQAFQGEGAAAPTPDAPTGPTGEAQPVPTGEAPNVNAPTEPSN